MNLKIIAKYIIMVSSIYKALGGEERIRTNKNYIMHHGKMLYFNETSIFIMIFAIKTINIGC